VRRVVFLCLSCLGLLTLGEPAVFAQLAAPALQAQKAPANRVGTITIKFVGTANVNEQVVRANMQIRCPF